MSVHAIHEVYVNSQTPQKINWKATKRFHWHTTWEQAKSAMGEFAQIIKGGIEEKMVREIEQKRDKMGKSWARGNKEERFRYKNKCEVNLWRCMGPGEKQFSSHMNNLCIARHSLFYANELHLLLQCAHETSFHSLPLSPFLSLPRPLFLSLSLSPCKWIQQVHFERCRSAICHITTRHASGKWTHNLKAY